MSRIICLFFAASVLLFPVSSFAAGHPLGMPQMEFCKEFVSKVSNKMPMPYKEFIKYTDGAGQPSGSSKVPDKYMHWEGMKDVKPTSFLNVAIVSENGQDWVKGGVATCPSQELVKFGEWVF